MPAGAEAVRAERAARRAQRAAERPGAPPPLADTGDGIGIIRASWAGTAILALGAVVGAAVPAARLAVVVMELALFLGGCVVFLWALGAAAQRSRDREIGLWSLFLLDRVAPRAVRIKLLAAIAVEIVVALITAAVAAPLAFGILVPVWGLGWSGLWGAKYGQFGPRRRPPTRGSRRGQGGPDADR